LLAECRAQIPFQEINNNYARDDDILYRGNALFLKHLTLYFKENVMTWVNQPPCQNCGNQTMESRQTRGPQTQEELDGGASRVEVYDCSSCQNTTTFPRYNSVRKLLETRKGRCGEYANLFGLYCRAVGFETRYVSDFTDHVWVECLVDGEWIMADACEGLIDKNSMYEDGWGKDLNYIIAVTPDSVIDVTPRYTRKWFSPEFQARRRGICSSEEASQLIIKQYNAKIQSDCSKNRREELDRRMEREQKMLNICQQTTEWTDEEKHGKGRISGSLEWKLSRKEAGDLNQTKDESSPSVKSWHVESFFPSNKKQGITISISNDGIVVSDAECSVIGSQISVVVIDEVYLGCILQSRGFTSWKDVADFVDTLPSHRIVAIHGSSSVNADSEKANGLSRLGGFTMPNDESKVLYLGQVDALPAWTKFASCNGSSKISVFMVPRSKLDVKLRTERDTVPSRVACRLPESIMPLQTQLLASEEQKRMAFLRFSGDKRATVKEYVGYTTKAGSPVYLLDASAYPFSKTEGGWNTFHYLPEPLVPKDDSGIVESTKKSGVPKIDIPLESFFFTTLLGPNVLVNSTPGSAPALVDTANALHNTRLVALYFSAHWCGPCRQFTPMLAELYSHLKDEYPTHGLEIVFVSSDRDPGGFQQYFGCMPWMAVPFGGTIIPQIKQRYTSLLCVT
jgi:peptide-N4-(N-acetyl-beta-glucosaminyl)asparagine amidase